jgi:hypothetical protein
MGIDDNKLKKNLQLKKMTLFKIKTRTYLSKKNIQVTKEAFSSQKRISSTSKHKISKIFLILWVIFARLSPDLDPDSECGYGSSDPIESRSNPDLQPCG